MTMNDRNAEDFKAPSELRTFCINTATDPLYVNLLYLAELSEYFKCISNHRYTEREANMLNMDDVCGDELAAFLSFVCPTGFLFNRTINQDNLLNLLYFSDRLMFPSLQNDIKMWLKSDAFKNLTFTPQALLDASIIFEQQGFKISEIEPVYRKLASMSEDEINVCLENVPEKQRILDSIRVYRKYDIARRPISHYDWALPPDDFRARIFF